MDPKRKEHKQEDSKDYELEEALREAKEKVEAKRRMRERQKKQNEAFIWSPENIEKIIRLNDKLWTLMQEADRIGKSMYSDFQKLAAEGKNYYDENADVEVCIIYEGGLAEGAEEDPLWDSVELWYGRNGYKFLDEYNGEPLNWNIIEFDRPEFKDHYFCYLMHWFFHEGLYSLQDAVTMDPDKFFIHTVIYN